MNHSPKQFVRAIATFMVPFYTLVTSTTSYAEVPGYGKVTQILGPNDLSLRSGSQNRPVSINSLLNLGQQLSVSGTNKTFTQLDFYKKSNESMGLAVQASTKNNSPTLYYFPCKFLEGDSLIIEWINDKGVKRGCERGIRVEPNQRLKLGAQLPNQAHPHAFQPLKQVLTAQASQPRFQYYCSVVSNSGRGWIGVTSSGDPCQEPLQQCQASGGGECTAVTLDQWTVKDSDLTALVACDNNQKFTAKGTGSTMKEQVSQLWQQAQSQGAKSCALRVLGSEDALVLPLPSNERTLIQTRNSDNCVVSEISSGAAMVKSAKKPEGVPLNPGQRYTYCGENAPDKIESFDPKNESVEVQVFRAPERGLKLCDQEQVSGGQAGDTRTIQLTAKEGELRIYYEMYEAKDSIQVIYEGRDLLNTGLVSGSNTVSIPFKGNSAQVKVVLTGNPGIETTKWKYTLYCPK